MEDKFIEDIKRELEESVKRGDAINAKFKKYMKKLAAELRELDKNHEEIMEWLKE